MGHVARSLWEVRIWPLQC